MPSPEIELLREVESMSHTKRPEDRQRRNMPGVLEAAPPAAAGFGPPAPAGRIVPRPPTGLGTRLRRAWEGLWSSPVAQLLDPVSDLPAVTRLFNLYKLEERLVARLDEHLAAMAVGRTPGCENLDCYCEQHVTVPAQFDSGLATARMKVAGEIRMIEGALGLSPRSRLALGLALLAGGRGGGKGGGSLDDAASAAGGA
jgi:hypothetical protein